MRQVVLDTETTGLRPSEGHRVIEIAAIEIIDYLPTGKTYQQYINPQRDVPDSSFKVHGLSYEFLKDKPLFEHIVSEFLEFLGTDPIIAHNVDFDVGFLIWWPKIISEELINKVYDILFTENFCEICIFNANSISFALNKLIRLFPFNNL